jgi:uncharacterized membrane protein (UPF0127 family)
VRLERAVRRSGSPIQLAVCEGPVERASGLLRRPPPLPGSAMWIAPCRAVHTWGMRYPIDVAFLDERGLVLQVAPNCAPRRVYSDRRAASVLEFRAGECARLHLRAGERLQLPLAPARPSPTPMGTPQGALPLAMIAALVIAVWMLNGCASAPREAPATHATEFATGSGVAPLDDLRLQADLEYESRAWPRAEQAYRELWHRTPADRTVRYRLAIALLHQGRHGEAADLLAQLDAEAPGHGDVLQALAIARVAIAANALRRASAIAPSLGVPVSMTSADSPVSTADFDAARAATAGPTGTVETAASRREPWRAAAEQLERLLPIGVSGTPSSSSGAMP